MSWTNRVVDVLMIGLISVVLVMCAISVCYMPGMFSAYIARDRAVAKALSGLDLRDEETRRAIRGLLGVEEVEK